MLGGQRELWALLLVLASGIVVWARRASQLHSFFVSRRAGGPRLHLVSFGLGVGAPEPVFAAADGVFVVVEVVAAPRLASLAQDASRGVARPRGGAERFF